MHIASNFSVNSIGGYDFGQSDLICNFWNWLYIYAYASNLVWILIVIPCLDRSDLICPIHGIRTYYSICIIFQPKFNHDTHLFFDWPIGFAGFRTYLYHISVCIQLFYLFCDQSNLIWKSLKCVYISEDQIVWWCEILNRYFNMWWVQSHYSSFFVTFIQQRSKTSEYDTNVL